MNYSFHSRERTLANLQTYLEFLKLQRLYVRIESFLLLNVIKEMLHMILCTQYICCFLSYFGPLLLLF